MGLAGCWLGCGSETLRGAEGEPCWACFLVGSQKCPSDGQATGYVEGAPKI